MKTQSVPESTNFIHTFSLCLSLHTTCAAYNRLFFPFHFLCVCVCALIIFQLTTGLNLFLANELLWVCNLLRVRVCYHHLLIVFYIILLFVSVLHLFVFLLPLQPLVKVTCFVSASDATNTRTVYRSSCSGWRKEIKK